MSAPWFTAVAVSGLLVALTTIAIAQQVPKIHGRVVDEQGQAVGDATVIISSVDGETTEIQTSTDGQFTAGELAAGSYTVTAVKEELGGEVFRILVRDDQTIAVNFMLEPGRRAATYLSEAGEREALSRRFEAGVEASRSRDYDLAVEQYLGALEISPTCLECHFNLAVAYMQLGRLAEAETEFRRVIVLQPNYAAAYYGLSGLYAGQGRQAEAVEARSEANRIALQRLAVGRAQAEDAVARGVVFLEAGNVADAIGRFEDAVAQDASLPAAHYWLGVALQESGRLPQSHSSLQRYLQLEPSGQFADDARERLDDLGP